MTHHGDESVKWAEKKGDSSSLKNLSGPELDAALRKRIETRMEERNGFFIHLIAFVGINPFLWLIWLLAGPRALPWPLFATIPWAVGFIIHGLVVYQGSAMALERRERQIAGEIEKEKARLGISDEEYEKPKRSEAMRLSDDGELVPAEDADIDSLPKAKRGQR